MIPLQVSLHALGAQHPAVVREVFPGLEPGDAVIAHFELNAALLTAKTAMSLDELLGPGARIALPPARRSVVQMRSILLAQLFRCARGLSHVLAPWFSFGRQTEFFVCTLDIAPASVRRDPEWCSRSRPAAGSLADRRCA